VDIGFSLFALRQHLLSPFHIGLYGTERQRETVRVLLVEIRDAEIVYEGHGSGSKCSRWIKRIPSVNIPNSEWRVVGKLLDRTRLATIQAVSASLRDLDSLGLSRVRSRIRGEDRSAYPSWKMATMAHSMPRAMISVARFRSICLDLAKNLIVICGIPFGSNSAPRYNLRVRNAARQPSIGIAAMAAER